MLRAYCLLYTQGSLIAVFGGQYIVLIDFGYARHKANSLLSPYYLSNPKLALKEYILSWVWVLLGVLPPGKKKYIYSKCFVLFFLFWGLTQRNSRATSVSMLIVGWKATSSSAQGPYRAKKWKLVLQPIEPTPKSFSKIFRQNQNWWEKKQLRTNRNSNFYFSWHFFEHWWTSHASPLVSVPPKSKEMERGRAVAL